MNDTSGFQEAVFFFYPPDRQSIDCCANNGIYSNKLLAPFPIKDDTVKTETVHDR